MSSPCELPAEILVGCLYGEERSPRVAELLGVRGIHATLIENGLARFESFLTRDVTSQRPSPILLNLENIPHDAYILLCLEMREVEAHCPHAFLQVMYFCAGRVSLLSKADSNSLYSFDYICRYFPYGITQATTLMQCLVSRMQNT